MSQHGGNTPPPEVHEDPPPPPIEAAAVVNAEAIDTDASSTRGGRRSARRVRSSSRHSSASGMTTDAADTDDPGMDSDYGVTRFLRPIATGVRMSLADQGRYTARQKQRVRQDIRRNIQENQISRALRESRKGLTDLLREPAYIVEPAKLYAGMETAKAADPKVYSDAKKDFSNMEKQVYTSPTKLEGLGDFLDNFVETVNDNLLNEQQAITLFKRHFKGAIGVAMRSMLQRVGLRETIRNYRRFKCDSMTVPQCEADIVKWKLSKNDVDGSIFDLFSKLVTAYPNSSEDVLLSNAKLRTKEYLNAQALKHLARAEQMERKRSGMELDLNGFIHEVEQVINTNSGGVSSASYGDVMNVSVAKDKAKSEDQDLRKALNELKLAQEKSLNELSVLKTQMAMSGPAMIHYQAVPPVTHMQPGPAQATGNGQATGSQDKGNKAYHPKDLHTHYGRVYLHPEGEHYKRASRVIQKSSLETNLPEVTHEKPYVDGPNGTYRPTHGMELKSFPKDKAVFCYDKRSNKYHLTQAVKDFFATRCPSCGLEGHRSGSSVCPLFGTADSWSICSKCSTGFHATCRLDPAAIPKNGARGAGDQ